MADDVKNAPNRVDGIMKVTGKAKYIAEWKFPKMAYGYLVHSTIAKGKIKAIDASLAEKLPGVVKVLTHLNTPKFAKAETDRSHRPLHNADVLFSGQAIGVVVAETFEQARYAASLVKVEYEKETPNTDLRKLLDKATVGRPSPVRGKPDEAFANSPVKIEAEYSIPIEHHNAMELHASVANWEGNKLTVYDKTQGVNAVRGHLAGIFGIPPADIVVLAPFVGGGFGAGLRPSPNVFLTALAAREVKRPVNLVYSRRQLFTAHGYRPYSIQKIKLSAERNGKLTAIIHESVNNSSTNQGSAEGITSISRNLYACPNVRTESKFVPTDMQTPQAMRAPGMVTGAFGLECALDELSYELGIDPLEMRLINYAEVSPEDGKPFTSKELRKCYAEGARRFGWEKRKKEVRATREGNWLVGYGMATGTWGSAWLPASARITIKADGTALVESSVTDIGPGTYTTLSIIASKNLGLPIEKIKTVLGDSTLPPAPIQGGSFTTASVGTAVQEGAQVVLKKLFEMANLGDYKFEETKVDGGNFLLKDGKRVSFVEILQRNNLDKIAQQYDATPNNGERAKYAIASHGAQYVEVKVDEELGIVRVTRVVEVTAAGKIINPKGAKSQEIGGVVWGIGMALTEETQIDHRYGRIMNPNFAGYYIPANADVLNIDTGFVEEIDTIINPLGVKGLGELGMVGIPPAIANAIYHATGKRYRDLPITPDKVMLTI
jgi:xanthine dehydrogenase YagR molybdenum-binding subunit